MFLALHENAGLRSSADWNRAAWSQSELRSFEFASPALSQLL
jgi:hypothetical protein